ncbi:MAG: septum formation initiator family protein [Thermoanaerobaculia bacterium]|nr:septum formation initiator family protein [Thermoanaerobaculia bacterium]
MSGGRTPGLVPSFRSILVLAVAGLLLLLLVGGLNGYRELSAARQREAEIEGRLEATRSEIQELERRIEGLSGDPEVIERLARDELMMMRPGELVVVYPRPPAEPAPEPAVETPPDGKPRPAASGRP